MPKLEAPKLILISVDGLLPGNYLARREVRGSNDGILRNLRSRGTYASSMTAVRPTLTLTNHASLVTGASADRHGIHSNTLFSPFELRAGEEERDLDWIFKSRFRGLPPLWELAERSGFGTALLRWPVSLGARARWVLPELFTTRSSHGLSTWELLSRFQSPELRAIAAPLLARRKPQTHEELDELVALLAIELLGGPEIPDLLMIHFTSMDHQMHENGRASVEAAIALRQIERHIARILEELDLSRTFVLIFGDHGFIDFDRRVHLNALFSAQDWIRLDRSDRVRDWRVFAHPNCAQAPIYLRDPSDPTLANRVLELLQDQASDRYRVVGQAELRRLRCHPTALCAVEACPGWSLGQRLRGESTENLEHVRSDHGHLSAYPELETGLIALGPGIEPARNLGRIHVLDLALAAAELLGLHLGSPEGATLPLLLPQRVTGIEPPFRSAR